MTALTKAQKDRLLPELRKARNAYVAAKRERSPLEQAKHDEWFRLNREYHRR